MDNLAREAMLAKEAGMSYGRWKAMQPAVEIVEPNELPPGWKSCNYCGKPFKKKSGHQVYCSMDCRNGGYAIKEREIKRRYLARKKEQMENEHRSIY